ncbi:L-aspartate oxidase [Raphidocelis subcapitata]|uniref:L-aspartate oxidase n=1 Tax=Raphidocelis subcapitata TaxID=307507 RepID=A0A2V0PR55_9CHLO|nr:L-aspartate oxidase [Raphidocelis subcapitata]|eukprot:GBF99735.1 L-aspartate oxidase [Raphidocelis subcapitata]
MVAVSACRAPPAPRRTAARCCAARAGAAQLPLRRAPAAAAAAAPRRASRARAVAPRADVNADAFGAPAWRAAAAAARPAPRAGGPAVRQFDFIVIGSGIAGLSYALKVAPYGKVAVITKDAAAEGCTRYAQGGVCAVLDPFDSVEKHVRDTIVAGAHLNDSKAVDVVCREGPARVLELVQLGADFTRNPDGTLHLTREGGHSDRRIVHAADLTGAEIERALLAAARQTGQITFFEHHLAVDLVTDDVAGTPHCFGVDVLDTRSHAMCRFLGLSTMLACGGAGQVYPATTNPHVATGDGIAMAYRAGAAVSNMEFVQFHPTALYSPNGREGNRTFLITEAVRGEGGMLFNARGERFMPSYDERLELAPRDVVARAIQAEMLSHGSDHVWLDISHKPRGEVLDHFPNISARCLEEGIDITKDPIPVLPAQHYTCGGVATGLRGEVAGVQGLYAAGEVACSGLHGANRLASNSLLEGLVFADRAAGPSVAHAEYALRHCGRQLHYAAATASFSGARAPRPLAGPVKEWAAAKRAELRDTMWRAAGIVRRAGELRAALAGVEALGAEVAGVAEGYGVAAGLVELSNLVTCAELILSCALQRRESRGLHYTPDYPSTDPAGRPSLVARRGAPAAPPAPAGGGARGGGGGAGAAGGAAGPGKRASVQRDLAVRSTPQDQE